VGEVWLNSAVGNGHLLKTPFPLVLSRVHFDAQLSLHCRCLPRTLKSTINLTEHKRTLSLVHRAQPYISCIENYLRIAEVGLGVSYERSALFLSAILSILIRLYTSKELAARAHGIYASEATTNGA
jgi:hypothetical protein